MTRVGGVTVFVAMLLVGGALGLALTGIVDRLQSPHIVISDPLPGEVIAVAIEGAVATPGVYELAADARLMTLLEQAGGTTEDADLAYLNLAARLADEQQITVPTKSPEALAVETEGVQGDPAAALGISSGAGARLNINTASEIELDGLPGIGSVLAGRIIEERAKAGAFESVDDLVRISGISQRMVDELRDRITV